MSDQKNSIYVNVNVGSGESKTVYEGVQVAPDATGGRVFNRYTGQLATSTTMFSAEGGVKIEKPNEGATYKFGLQATSYLTAQHAGDAPMIEQTYRDQTPPYVTHTNPLQTNPSSGNTEVARTTFWGATGSMASGHEEGAFYCEGKLGAGMVLSSIKTTPLAGMLAQDGTLAIVPNSTSQKGFAGLLGFGVGMDEGDIRPGIKVECEAMLSKAMGMTKAELSAFKTFHIKNGPNIQVNAGLSAISMTSNQGDDLSNNSANTVSHGLVNVGVGITLPTGRGRR